MSSDHDDNTLADEIMVEEEILTSPALEVGLEDSDNDGGVVDDTLTPDQQQRKRSSSSNHSSSRNKHHHHSKKHKASAVVDVAVAGPVGVVPGAAASASISSSHTNNKKNHAKAKNSSNSTSGGGSNSSSSRNIVSNNVRLRSVVKLYSKKVAPSQIGPWKMLPESSSTGTGFIIPNRRLLTNAHVVYQSQSILCRPQIGSRKFECEVESISLPLDLAVLKIKSKSDEEVFFNPSTNHDYDKKEPLSLVPSGFENLPNLDDNVTAVGFPQGGDQISVTRGVVSRITHNTSKVLWIQIDAAINPGNSGGPVFNTYGQVMGVACAGLRNANNIGYIIPSMIVQLFFESTKLTNGICNAGIQSKQNPDGFCGVASLGIGKIQKLENQTLRQHLGLLNTTTNNNDSTPIAPSSNTSNDNANNDTSETANNNEVTTTDTTSSISLSGVGVRVRTVDYVGACYDPINKKFFIQPSDVLLCINDISIGEDGTVQIPGRPEERIPFETIVACQLPSKPIKVTLLRNSQIVNVIIPKPIPKKFLCPQIDGFDSICPPQYIIIGGFVFMVLTRPLVVAFKSEKCSRVSSSRLNKLTSSFLRRSLLDENRQIIVLSSVLANSINNGYHDLSGLVLREFNGCSTIFNLQHLATLIETSNHPLLEFRLGIPNLKPNNNNNNTDTDPSSSSHGPQETMEPQVNGTTNDSQDIIITESEEQQDEIIAIMDRKEVIKADPIIRKAHLIASTCSSGIKFKWPDIEN